MNLRLRVSCGKTKRSTLAPPWVLLATVEVESFRRRRYCPDAERRTIVGQGFLQRLDLGAGGHGRVCLGDTCQYHLSFQIFTTCGDITYSRLGASSHSEHIW